MNCLLFPFQQVHFIGASLLVGRKVLTAHLEDGACGWFMGTEYRRQLVGWQGVEEEGDEDEEVGRQGGIGDLLR